MGVIVGRNELLALGEKLRRQGKTVVATNGCFDILHVGHSRILQESRALGDLLVVGINSDESVSKLKGPSRPINNEKDRAELLCALACVDYVSIFAEETAGEFLDQLKPNLYVKGADYKPEELPETPVVERNGGRVIILELVPGRSTSSVVAKIREP